MHGVLGGNVSTVHKGFGLPDLHLRVVLGGGRVCVCYLRCRDVSALAGLFGMLGLRCGISAQCSRSLGVERVRVVCSRKVLGLGRECVHELCGWHLRGVGGHFGVLELSRRNIRFRGGSIVVLKLRGWNFLRVNGGVIVVKLHKLLSGGICSHGRIERVLQLRCGHCAGDQRPI